MATAIPRAAEAGLRLEDVAEVAVELSRGPFDDLGRIIGGAIVDDDHLHVGVLLGLLGEVSQAIDQFGRSVPRADDDRE